MTDYNLWINDINNRFSPTSLTHTTIGSTFKATAIISGVTTHGLTRMSLWDAYKSLRETLLGVSESDSNNILPKSTTTQASALSGIIDGTRILNITAAREEVCNNSSFISTAGSESNSVILAWTSQDSSGIQAGKTYMVQPWSSLSGLRESSTPDIGDQIMMPFAGAAKNLYVTVFIEAGSDQSHKFIIEKNGSDQSLTVELDNQETGNDTTNSFSFVAGDFISLKAIGSSNCADSGEFKAAIELYL